MSVAITDGSKLLSRLCFHRGLESNTTNSSKRGIINERGPARLGDLVREALMAASDDITYKKIKDAKANDMNKCLGKFNVRATRPVLGFWNNRTKTEANSLGE